MKVSVLLFFILCFCLAGHIVFAQPTSVRPLGLDESIQLALANSSQMKKGRLDRQILERRVKEARSAALPQIEGGVNLDFIPVLPTRLLPGELFGQADGTYVPAQFDLPWQLGGSVSLQQQIFNESLRRGVSALNVTRGISDLLLERSEEDVIFNTATVFYQTLQMEQLLRAADANLDKIEALQGMAELQLANDYAVPLDVKRIRVARSNLQTQRQNLLSGINSLRQTLQFLCGISADEKLDLQSEMGAPAADSSRWLSLALETETTTEHRLLMHNLELTRIQRRSALGEGYPSLSAYAALGAQAFREDANFFDPDRRWYGMVAVGFKLKIPIFDGFRLHNKSLIFRLEEQKLEEDRRQLAGAKSLEFNQAQDQLQNALRSLRSQADNVALAREITDKILLQYKEGVASLTDLLNAQTAFAEAETNYWQQVFTYKLAVLKLLKAAGKLEELKSER